MFESQSFSSGMASLENLATTKERIWTLFFYLTSLLLQELGRCFEYVIKFFLDILTWVAGCRWMQWQFMLLLGGSRSIISNSSFMSRLKRHNERMPYYFTQRRILTIYWISWFSTPPDGGQFLRLSGPRCGTFSLYQVGWPVGLSVDVDATSSIAYMATICPVNPFRQLKSTRDNV